MTKRHRSAETGEFVSEEFAAAHPNETVSETVLSDEDREAERERLKGLLRASLGQPGYKDRVKEIEAQLAKLPDGD